MTWLALEFRISVTQDRGKSLTYLAEKKPGTSRYYFLVLVVFFSSNPIGLI